MQKEKKIKDAFNKYLYIQLIIFWTSYNSGSHHFEMTYIAVKNYKICTSNDGFGISVTHYILASLEPDPSYNINKTK